MTEYDGIARIYDSEWSELKGDLEFITELAGKYGSPVLELAVGTGRIAIHLAEKGFEVAGIDNSEEMLKLCRDKISKLSKDVASKIKVEPGNMSNFSLNRSFKFVFVPFNSFLLQPNKTDQENCLKCAYNHLDDDGIFMVDIFSPNFKLCAEEKSDIRFLRHFYFPPEQKVIMQWEYVERNMAEQVLDIDFLYEEYDKNGNINRHTRHLTMGVIFRYEMQLMLEKNGFEIVEFYGNHDKSKFTNESPQLIYICKKNTSFKKK